MRTVRYCAVMALCCMLLSAGCSGRPESRAVAVNPCGWKSVEEREVSFVNSDTVSLRELSVFAVTGGRCSAGCDSLPAGSIGSAGERTGGGVPRFGAPGYQWFHGSDYSGSGIVLNPVCNMPHGV